MPEPRGVVQVVEGRGMSDGAGVRLQRSIGVPELDHADPFLLLDEFRSDRPDDYLAGFPDHPHRGFETVTYMLAGSMRHRDHAGNEGHLRAGSVQWMTAGRGIIHSEMPEQEDGLMWGFQLWINLPRQEKMCLPRYQDIAPESVPVVEGRDGSRVRVIAGKLGGQRGPVEEIVTRPLYLDVALPPGARFEHPVPRGHCGLGYLFEGEGRFGVDAPLPAAVLEAGRLAVLGDGDSLVVTTGERAARFLLLAAAPIGEPVARHGPFVMNTSEEIRQAIRDLQAGTFLD